jgi:hypothetical protein
MSGRPAHAPTPPRREWWWIFDPRCSLRARATLTAGALALGFTLFLAWMAGVLYRRVLEYHLASSFETLAFQVADKLDRTIYERYRTLQLAARLPVLGQADAAPPEHRRVLDSIQESAVEFAWVGLTDAQGRIVAATSRLFEGNSAASRPWFLGARETPFIGAVR